MTLNYKDCATNMNHISYTMNNSEKSSENEKDHLIAKDKNHKTSNQNL